MREAGPPRYFASALGAAEEFRQAAALASAPLGQVLPSVQHINDQTSTDEVIAPFGGGLSGNGYRIGGQEANLEAFTEMQWITVNQEPGSYPF